MSLTINKRTINRVLVVDDNQAVRQDYGYAIEELGLEPVYETGPLRSLDELLKQMSGKADALVCDYHLRIKNFSQFNGDLLVASFNRERFPALLCTTYTDSDVTVMRSKRRFIPTLLKPATYNPETIRLGFERCICEGEGNFDPSRKPWRTLVRIAEIEEKGGYFYVIVPGWNADEKIRVYLDDVPGELRKLIKPSQRLHAQVNLGAEAPKEMYFSDWEGV